MNSRKRPNIIWDSRTLADFCVPIVYTPMALFVLFSVCIITVTEIANNTSQSILSILFPATIIVILVSYTEYLMAKLFFRFFRKYEISESGITVYSLTGNSTHYTWEKFYCIDVAKTDVNKKEVPIIRCFWNTPKKDWNRKIYALDTYLLTSDSVWIFSCTPDRLVEFEKYTKISIQK